MTVRKMEERCFDQLFMHEAWAEDDILLFQKYSNEIIGVFIKVLSAYHRLSERQIYFLSFEWAEIALAAFCDTLFRLKKQNIIEEDTDTEGALQFRIKLDEYIKNCAGMHPGFSRKFRLKLANLILLAFQSCPIDESTIKESKEIKLKEWLGKKRAAGMKFCFRSKMTAIYWLDMSLRKRWENAIGKKKEMPLRIGVLNLQRLERIIFSMPEINWISVENEHLLSDLTTLPCDRDKLYAELLDQFKNEVKAINCPLDMKDEVKEKLDEILFGTLIVTIRTNLLDREKLWQRLEEIKNYLRKLNLQLIISKGAWSNGLLAVAAIGLKLPLVLMQLGGAYGVLYFEHGMYDLRLRGVDHYLGYGWGKNQQRLIDQSAIKDTILHKVSDPDLNIIKTIGSKHNIKNESKRILYSPFVHSALYRTELWSDYYPENTLRIRQEMEKLFCLLYGNGDDLKEYEIYVKLKAFGYRIFEGQKHLFGCVDFPEKAKVFYLIKGVSQWYFNSMRLHIIDSICTGLMYSLVFNLPTVAYWDLKTQRLTSQAKPIFEGLKKYGVLGTNAEEMVESIIKYLRYPEEWHRKEIQEIRNAYIENFSWAHKEWKEEINGVLNNIAKKREENDVCR